MDGVLGRIFPLATEVLRQERPQNIEVTLRSNTSNGAVVADPESCLSLFEVAGELVLLPRYFQPGGEISQKSVQITEGSVLAD